MADSKEVATVKAGAGAVATGGLHFRLPYPKPLQEYAGIGPWAWGVLLDTIFPAANTVEAIVTAVAYCKERHLDIMKRPIHIVPVYSTKQKKYVETIWPGVSELRTTASRTGVYAGVDEALFGDDMEHVFKHTPRKSGRGSDEEDGDPQEHTMTFPSWCQITVYRIVGGQRCAFVGPKVYWLEAYASKSYFNEIPNDMWRDRARGQLEKCAEAAALRRAFPEEIGNEYAAEEMHGRVMNDDSRVASPDATGPITPPRPQRSDFDRQPEKPVEKSDETAAAAEGTGTAASGEQANNDGEQPASEETGAANPNTESWQKFKDAALWKLAEAKMVKDVAAVRELFAPEFEGEEAKWWDRVCDDRQKAVMEERMSATGTGKKKT